MILTSSITIKEIVCNKKILWCTFSIYIFTNGGDEHVTPGEGKFDDRKKALERAKWICKKLNLRVVHMEDRMLIKKIISGGQTGADRAGLRAAKFLDIPTGGYMPLNWWTLEGPRPDIGKLYNMQECKEFGYKARTWLNVKESDGTVRFATDFNSPGERCTYNAIKNFQKPFYDIPIELIIGISKSLPFNFIKWIEDNNINILNVAGNSEQTYPGIEEIVHNWIITVLKY